MTDEALVRPAEVDFGPGSLDHSIGRGMGRLEAAIGALDEELRQRREEAA